MAINTTGGYGRAHACVACRVLSARSLRALCEFSARLPRRVLPHAPLRPAMDERPRLAFREWSDDSDNDQQITVEVVGFAGNICSATLPEHYTVHDLKKEIERRITLPEADLVLLLNGVRLRARQTIGSVFLASGRVVTLVASQPRCRHCGVRDGIFGRRAKLSRCPVCPEAFYCSRECTLADWQAHRRECF